jgi:ABC-type antimicrobial peptide transport system ATPase subunit
VIDKAHAAQLKQVNVEMANRTAVLMADDPDALAEPSLAEQLYRMVFKRNAKKEGKEEKKEEGCCFVCCFWRGMRI